MTERVIDLEAENGICFNFTVKVRNELTLFLEKLTE